MKQLTFCLLLLAFLLLFCIGAMTYVTDGILMTEQHLLTALEQYDRGRYLEAQTSVEAAAACWNRYESAFCMLLRHSEIDHAGEEFSKLLAYVSSDDQDDFRSSGASLLSDLAHIREMEQPTLSNIF